MNEILHFLKTKFFILFFPIISYAQNQIISNDYGFLIKHEFTSSAFPDPMRINGHTYNHQHYEYQSHYHDSSVYIFIPKYFSTDDSLNIVFHFHGWYNQIDSVLKQFNLIEQFYKAKKNAILVVPQGPKNAPDSYGGKLESSGQFSDFVSDILSFLKNEEFIDFKNKGNFILSGHSGAYRVMSYILFQGGLTKYIREVFLFDGLYAQQEKYALWIEQGGRLTNIYTDDGGTFENSIEFTKSLDSLKIKHTVIKASEMERSFKKDFQVRTVYSPLDHNDVIHKNENFMKLIQASPFLH